MAGGERGHHRQSWEDGFEGEHRLDAFTRGSNIENRTESDSVPKKLTHCTAGIVNRGLDAAVARKPSTEHASDIAGTIRDGRDQSRPCFEGGILVGAVVAAGMETQRGVAQEA